MNKHQQRIVTVIKLWKFGTSFLLDLTLKLEQVLNPSSLNRPSWTFLKRLVNRLIFIGKY
jgi:hypothetical protein